MLSFADDVPLLVYNSYVLSFYYFLKKVSSNEPILVMFSLVCFSYNAVLHKGRKKVIWYNLHPYSATEMLTRFSNYGNKKEILNKLWLKINVVLNGQTLTTLFGKTYEQREAVGAGDTGRTGWAPGGAGGDKFWHLTQLAYGVLRILNSDLRCINYTNFDQLNTNQLLFRRSDNYYYCFMKIMYVEYSTNVWRKPISS